MGFANCDRSSPDCETPITATGATCWPHYLGTAAFGGAPDQMTSAALLADGTHFVGGDFNRVADFDPGAGLDIHTPVSPPDAFVTKLAADGSLAWARSFGGMGDDRVNAVAAAPDGSVVAVGRYSGTVDFDPGPGVDSHTTASEAQEPFVVKFGADGAFVWARTFPAAEFQIAEAQAVAVAADGSVYVEGYFQGTIDLDPGPGTAEQQADSNGFLVKLNGSGGFVWGRALGGADCFVNTSSGLAVGKDGSVWTSSIVSQTCSLDPTDAPKDDVSDTRTLVGGFAANGDFRRAWRLLANGDRTPLWVADDAVYLGGVFTGVVDFDPGPNKTERASVTDVDGSYVPAGFVAKYGLDGAFRWVVPFQSLLVVSLTGGDQGILALGNRFEVGSDISGTALTALDPMGTSIFSFVFGGMQTAPGAVAASGGRFVVVGQTDGLTDFDPGPGTDFVDRGAVNIASRFSF
jgi:hypothetical protein